MLNFTYYNPTKIVFGTQTVAKLNELIPGGARILVLYGGASAEKNGTLAEVRNALQTFPVQEFGGIEANPEYETLMRAVQLVQQEKIDFLIAVGGGSVIDGAKFIAAAACYEGDPWEILLTRGSKIKCAIPLGTVLTLPATGSEMNANSVITRRALKAKLAFVNKLVCPVFSILDPTKTYSLPQRQVANGVVDSFVHIMEQYLTYPVHAMVQDKFAESLLQILIEIGPKVLVDEHDYDSRANFMWTATLALNGLIGAGVPQDWATHQIGHELTALYGIDHAQTLAIVLPSLMHEERHHKHAKLLQYAKNVWGLVDGDEDERIHQAIEKTRQFFENMGIKTHLSDYGIDPTQIDTILAQLQAHGQTKLGENGSIDLAVSRKILEHCF